MLATKHAKVLEDPAQWTVDTHKPYSTVFLRRRPNQVRSRVVQTQIVKDKLLFEKDRGSTGVQHQKSQSTVVKQSDRTKSCM
ncbi:predicted protein [Botrytis cinerea T4]|uniref:Uncharacterized protein n=1 Tax=Botryotinia fuckeliana (strain T4) TaxID=999810 RepID=G2YCY9_BOTF4|nr:predicted protein [Botrytis cinerea T4]